jgi:heat shock protein HtpX
MNIYEAEASNKRWTVAIMAAFLAFFLFLGLGFDVFVMGMRIPGLDTEGVGLSLYRSSNPDEASSYPIPYGTIVSLMIAGGLLLNSIYNGAAMALASCGARKADPSNPAEKQLLDVVDEMAIAAGLPAPQAYVIPDDDPNAFATGFGPRNAYIAATRGLLAQLNREELQGVIAHEMSHVRNYDVRLMTVIAALLGAISLVSDFTSRSARFGGRVSSGSRSSGRSEGKGGGGLAVIIFIIWIICAILAPFISRILAMAVSRHREYLADASGAELTRNPQALASALEKIRAAVAPTRAISSDGVAHMCIDDPRGTALNERHGFFADLFATHPPMQKRILALKLMAYNKPVNI